MIFILRAAKTIISRRMRWARYVARMGELINAFAVLVGRHDGNRRFRRRSRWEDDMNVDPKGIVCESVDRVRMYLDKGRRRSVVNTATSLDEVSDYWRLRTDSASRLQFCQWLALITIVFH